MRIKGNSICEMIMIGSNALRIQETSANSTNTIFIINIIV